MKLLIPYLKKYRIAAILSPLFMLLEVVADIAIPYLMSKIVDIGIENGDIDYVVKVGILMIICALLAIVFGVLSAHYGAIAGHGFAAEIRNETFKRIQGYSFANLDKFSVSSLITRLTNDCTTIGQVTMMTLRMAVRSPFMMLFALIMAFGMNPSLAKIFMITIPFTAIVMFIVLKKARPLFLRMQKRVDRVNGIIKENLMGIGVVKSFNRQEHEEKRFKERNDDLMQNSLLAISTILLMMPVLNVVINATIVAVLWFGGKFVVAGTMGTGQLLSFITYINQIMMSLMMISMFFMQLLRGIASVDRINEVWTTTSEIVEAKNPVKVVKNGDIEFNNVSFKYLSSKDYVLKNINFKIESGETLGVIGSTGSSKSSLVQLIPRLYDVNKGSIKVGDVEVRDYDIKVLRDNVSFVLQKNTLFAGTIRSNMQWGNENASDEEIITALKQAQAWEFVSKYDNPLEYKVEQGGNNFSGGQKQRLAIARALVKKPKVLVLDDSTSAVDMNTDAKIQKAFKEELSSLTKIIIAQRISSIEHADRILVIHEGEIESLGTHEELLKSSPIYKDIYQSQERGVIE